MSRTIPVALQTHLDSHDRTMAECLVVEQQATGSSAVLRVTTTNASVVIASGDFAGTYVPLGYVRKDTVSEDGMGVGTSEVDGLLVAPYLVEDDIRAGRWDGATWIKFKVNYVTPADGQIELDRGTLGNITWGRSRFTAELLDLFQRLQNGIGRLNSALCIHKFGASDGGVHGELGNGCTVDLTSFTFTGTVDSMDSDFYGIHDSARVEVDSYFSNGIFRVTSGVMNGMEREIRAYIVGFWVLFESLPYDVTGETYEIVRGCNKTRRQCIDDFDKILDRLASDWTQGNDAAVQPGRST